MTGDNLLGIPPTLLNPEPGSAALAAAEASGPVTKDTLEELVRTHPTSSLLWAELSDAAQQDGETVASYAYARVGYHRGLDALRKGGWRGQGPVPWSHEPNRGVLRALYALKRGAEAIGETDEVTRLDDFLRGADPTAIHSIEAGSEPAEGR